MIKLNFMYCKKMKMLCWMTLLYHVCTVCYFHSNDQFHDMDICHITCFPPLFSLVE